MKITLEDTLNSVAIINQNKIKRKLKNKILIKHALIILVAVIMIYPLIWMLISSFKPESMIFNERLWSDEFTLENYVRGWAGVSKVTFLTFYKNSFFLVFLTIIGNVFSCSLTAFAFARLKFKFKKFWFAIMFITMMLPIHVVTVPQYIIFSKLGWIDTILPLVVPKFLATDAFFIFLISQFMRTIPKEIDYAAEIDGCNLWQNFTRILIPLSLPALISTMIFTFIQTWNNFFTQLLYLNNIKNFTISLGLRLFLDSLGQSFYGALFAMSVLSLIPIFLMFIFFQKYLVEGIASGAVKG